MLETLQTFWMIEVACCKQYEHFKLKKMCDTNMTKVLNERECASKTLQMHVTNTANVNMKLYVQDHTSF